MTRRPLIVLVAGLLLAACSGESNAADDTAPAPRGAETVTVEHLYGTTEVPVRPARIVSLDLQWTDVLLAMDAPPIAYLRDPNAPDGFPWRGDGLDDATALSASTALPFEEITRLEPDLIVVSYLAEDQAAYDTLSAIAPTIPLLSTRQVDPWQDIAEVAGQVLDAPERARALVDDVAAEVDAVATDLPGLAGRTFALVNYVPGDAFYIVSDPDDGANVLFAELGLEIAPAVLAAGDGTSGRVEISLERADLLDADVLVLFTNGADASEVVGYDDLPAVRNGAVAVLDYADVSGLNTPTPLSVPHSLEVIRPALEAAAG